MDNSGIKLEGGEELRPVWTFNAADPRLAGDCQLQHTTWPLLDRLGLTVQAREVRCRGIGGSDANIILSGDRERILRLWQEKRGELAPEDLSSKLSVVLGSWTEEFNRQWYERLSGQRVINAGVALTCSRHGWRMCTLDGAVEGSGAIFEAKHTNSFVKPEDVLERYMPQLQHNMAVAKAERAPAAPASADLRCCANRLGTVESLYITAAFVCLV